MTFNFNFLLPSVPARRSRKFATRCGHICKYTYILFYIVPNQFHLNFRTPYFKYEMNAWRNLNIGIESYWTNTPMGRTDALRQSVGVTIKEPWWHYFCKNLHLSREKLLYLFYWKGWRPISYIYINYEKKKNVIW